ncbi:MAG: phosphate acetyltransferase [Verrucomicrobiales bacterium]|jgi:phosphate acetyltransferase|nr:phosphate acetyltransferase [Verrucomicrobiales bacterium]
MARFIETVYEKLRRHPKRIVFPEGHDARVLRAASEYAAQQLGPAVVLGRREEVEALAAAERIPLRHILIIDPEHAADLPLFARRLEVFQRYRGIKDADAARILANPNYFAAMMLQGGQCDGLVAGASEFSGNILRPLFQLIKPLPGIKTISGVTILEVPDSPFGDRGILFFADCGVVPAPTVEQLADITVEAARLRRQLTGAVPRVALLSFSTKGSARTRDTERIIAATALARQKARESGLKAEIDGELQVDAALLPDLAAKKAPGSLVAGRAEVLIFPDLNAGNIAVKLVQHLARATAYGQILTGLSKPAAELSRGARVEDILGVAALVALQAVEYRKLYPDQQGAADDWLTQHQVRA